MIAFFFDFVRMIVLAVANVYVTPYMTLIGYFLDKYGFGYIARLIKR